MHVQRSSTVPSSLVPPAIILRSFGPSGLGDSHLTNIPPGPTIFALILKFLKLSNPINNLSSGHFSLVLSFCPNPSGIGSPKALLRATIVLSSSNGPSSWLINSWIFSTAFSREIIDFDVTWIKSGTSPGASFVRSGTHTPFVVTDAPVSSSIYTLAENEHGECERHEGADVSPLFLPRASVWRNTRSACISRTFF